MPTPLDRRVASIRLSRASGSGTESSCRIHNQCPGPTSRSARASSITRHRGTSSEEGAESLTRSVTPSSAMRGCWRASAISVSSEARPVTTTRSGRRSCRRRESRACRATGPPGCVRRRTVRSSTRTRGRSRTRVTSVAGTLGGALDGALLQLATLPLGKTAPDAEALVVCQGVLQALGAHLAADADLLGLTRRAALLREEGLGVSLCAQCALLPRGLLGIGVGTRQECHDLQLVHGSSKPRPAQVTTRELHACHALTSSPR